MNRIVQLSIGGAIIAAILIGIVYQGFESTVFFYTPAEILAAPAKFKGKLVRVGALVQQGSTRWDEQTLRLKFSITEDSKSMIPVVYYGLKPDMYRAGLDFDDTIVRRFAICKTPDNREIAIPVDNLADQDRLHDDLVSGAIDAGDIEPFLVALFQPGNYSALYPDCNINTADINQDGSIDALDIEPFLDLLF